MQTYHSCSRNGQERWRIAEGLKKQPHHYLSKVQTNFLSHSSTPLTNHMINVQLESCRFHSKSWTLFPPPLSFKLFLKASRTNGCFLTNNYYLQNTITSTTTTTNGRHHRHPIRTSRQVNFFSSFFFFTTKIFVDPPSPPCHHTTTWKGPERESWKYQPDQQDLIFAGRQIEDSRTLTQPSPDIDNVKAKSRPAASYRYGQTAWGWSHLVWVFIQEYVLFSSVLFHCTNDYYQLNIVCISNTNTTTTTNATSTCHHFTTTPPT